METFLVGLIHLRLGWEQRQQQQQQQQLAPIRVTWPHSSRKVKLCQWRSWAPIQVTNRIGCLEVAAVVVVVAVART